MRNSLFVAAILTAGSAIGAAPDKPTSFCYATIGPGIQSRLQLHNTDRAQAARFTVRVQTLDGAPVGPPVRKELPPGENFEALFGPAESLQQLWALVTVAGPARKGPLNMHADGVVEGAFITEKTATTGLTTRTSTLTPILIQDPGDKPRGIEPNQSVLRLGAFFTGEFAFVGNPRDHPLDVSFCAPRTGQCWKWKLGPHAALSVSLADFKTVLGIASLDEYISCRFGGATAFLNMRNAASDSAITFGGVPQPR